MNKDDNYHQASNTDPVENERRFRALVAATSDVIYSLSPDWEVMQELDGRGFLPDSVGAITNWRSQNIPADEQPRVNAVISEAIRDKKIFQMEHRVIRADGTIGWTFSKAIPILNKECEITEWLGTASDITERIIAEQALQETRALADKQRRIYETITSNTPDLMYVFDLQYRFTYVNSALLTMWGKTWDNAVGKGLLENGYEPWHAEMHEREIDQVKNTKQPIRGEVAFPHAVLGKRVYDYIFTPVFNEKGEVEAVAGATRDVTERKLWEESLERSSIEMQAVNEELATTNEEHVASNEELVAINEELANVNNRLVAAQKKVDESQTALRLAISAANFGTWYIHSVTREFITDDRLKELFGYYPGEELSIEQAIAQIPDDYRDFVSAKLENAIYNNGDYDLTYPVLGLHDDRLRWLRAIGNLKADPSGAFSAFTGVVMDITEQVMASDKIKAAEETLRMAIASGELATWRLDEASGKLTASKRFNELFGFEADDDVSYDQAIAQIVTEYKKIVLDAAAASFANGANFNVEYPVIGYRDGKKRWIRSIGKFVEDNKNGNYITGVMADITEQKADELRKNDFIGMVSHELKTPLTSLTAIVQVLHNKFKTSEDAFIPGVLAKAEVQVKKMSTMINGFLNISRLESGKLIIDKLPFVLGELLQEVADEISLTGSTHHITLADDSKAAVEADRDKIGSVISNLLSNAVKYSPKGTEIVVKCTRQDNNILVSVADEGLGIRPEDRKRLFDRFYRVENNHTRHISGFGIGLYLSAEIIHRHDGEIWVESNPGQGSTFFFSLPIGKV